MANACECCELPVPLSWRCCPHCARPGLFPNVRQAEVQEEQDKLDERYKEAIQSATQRNREDIVRDFENAIGASRAVINRFLGEVQRLATSDKELYTTYYELRGLRLPRGSSVPDGPNWDVLRAVADTALFGDENKKEIRFAALTLDDLGLQNYGECSLVLRDNMIAHRASVFEENSILFMIHHQIEIGRSDNLPKGYRSTWDGRSKVCVAKLSSQITPTTQPDDFPKLLLQQGETSVDDKFVEVHIFGPMTIRTFAHVVITRRRQRPSQARINALREMAERVGMTCQVRN